MPKLNALLETAVYVSDVQRSADFYRNLFGFDTLLISDRLIALDVLGRSVLLLFKIGATSEPLHIHGGTIPGHGCTGINHFAFSINAEDLEPWKAHLATKNVPIESTLTWPGGAVSLYFRDPDNHVVELITRGFWRTY